MGALLIASSKFPLKHRVIFLRLSNFSNLLSTVYLDGFNHGKLLFVFRVWNHSNSRYRQDFRNLRNLNCLLCYIYIAFTTITLAKKDRLVTLNNVIILIRSVFCLSFVLYSIKSAVCRCHCFSDYEIICDVL